MSGGWVRRGRDIAASLFAVHLTADALLVKLGSLVYFAYPYLGLHGILHYNPHRGLRAYRTHLMQHR